MGYSSGRKSSNLNVPPSKGDYNKKEKLIVLISRKISSNEPATAAFSLSTEDPLHRKRLKIFSRN